MEHRGVSAELAENRRKHALGPDRVLGLELRPGAWVGVRGAVRRETRPEVLAGLAELDAPDLRSSCAEVEVTKDGPHARDKHQLTASHSAADR